MNRQPESGAIISDLFPEAVIGAAAGIVAGLWAVHVHKELNDIASILLALGGADAALLAVVLAAVALLATFLNGFFGKVIEKASTPEAFFRPFWLVAVVSGLAIIACFAGAIDAERDAKDSRAVLFGLAVGLSTWTVVGTVALVREFIGTTIEKRELE